MSPDLRVLLAILLVIGLIALAVVLRRLRLIEESDSPLFSRLVTKATLPALVFSSLAASRFEWKEGLMALLLALSGLVCLGLGWLLAHVLRLERGQRAPLIMCCGFGSASFLGIPLVADVYSSEAGAVSEAIVLAGLGSQPLVFTLGTIVAIYYGEAQASDGAMLAAVRRYLTSPLFIAFAGGLLVSWVSDETAGPAMRLVLHGLQPIGAANLLLVTLSMGLLLRFDHLSGALKLLIPVGLVKLVLMPILAAGPAKVFVLPDWHLTVLLLEAAMPSALISVVFCNTYGADARLAARLVVGVTVLSVLTLPLVFALFT